MNREQIESMTGTELVAAYNAVPGVKLVKRFASHADGVKRLTAAMAQQAPAKPAARKGAKAAPPPAAEPERAVAPAAKPTPAPAPAKAPAKQQKAAKPAPAPVASRVYAANAAGKLPRPGSKRDQLLALLRQPAGLSVEEICQRFEWKANDAKDALYLLARKNGVAVACGADGRWHAQ